ncbi:NAD(P)-dependent oxidoreductase [Conexibacter woesei]|uniref:NmrA family protein n=1 Tax=Conexibacter woesei (strain DSM 14684 / CCUG 47730 / CIP 108061 / JCM 11494 / NBRC 100937 / ID131577) TaxID=469383 RepID=D3F686_CONWI|nr:NAD(P)H-binding protein [Conexibacter woesei]ADB48759.1 NmrA family protein [Conexibacter woesei DSM 14684]
MSRIVVFGAGGRLGRLVVAEARGRGHEVTAVVRDPAAHADLASGSGAADASAATGATDVRVVVADATDATAIAAAAAGHDAAISTIPPPLIDPPLQYLADAHAALLAGLEAADVGRLLAVGMAGTLETEPGVRLLDTPDYKAEWLPFSRSHEAGLDALLGAETPVDWLAVSPPLLLDAEAARTGEHRVRESVALPTPDGGRVSYADLAAALVDEVERPAHHRTRVVVTAP